MSKEINLGPISDLDSPEKIAEATERLRISLGLPEPLTRDDQPYAYYDYRRRPPLIMWNHARIKRELKKRGLR